jgi:hypothetical protein
MLFDSGAIEGRKLRLSLNANFNAPARRRPAYPCTASSAAIGDARICGTALYVGKLAVHGQRSAGANSRLA